MNSVYKAWHFTYSIELERPVINIWSVQQKWRVLKFTESHDTVKAFCGCGLGWKNRRFLLNVVLALRTWIKRAFCWCASAHNGAAAHIAHADVQVLSWVPPKLNETSIVRRRVTAKASCPTPSLRSIGRPVCYIESATHGALLLLVRSTLFYV